MITGQVSPNSDVRTWNETTNASTVIAPAIDQDGVFFVKDGVRRDIATRTEP